MREDIFRFDSNKKQKKIFKASLVFILACSIGILCYSAVKYLINIDKTATIEVTVMPSDAKVLIDNREFPTKATIKIKPGIYPVEIKKEGLVTYTGEIQAIANETVYLYEYLLDADGNLPAFEQNSEDASRLQQIDDMKTDLEREKYLNGDPIWDATPYDNYSSGYRITADKDEQGKITVNIFLYTCMKDKIENLKTKALDYLKDNKIDLEKYTVNYRNCS